MTEARDGYCANGSWCIRGNPHSGGCVPSRASLDEFGAILRLAEAAVTLAERLNSALAEYYATVTKEA